MALPSDPSVGSMIAGGLGGGTLANVMFAPHRLIQNPIHAALGKGSKPYATGQFDQNSAQARADIENFLGTTEASRRAAFQESVQRGIQNREQAKLMEVARMVGPQLEATRTGAIPEFLGGGGQLYSGADRGTDYGRSLEGAIGRGETSVPEIPVELGAKGTSRGLANEAIPRYQSQPYFNPLTPAAQLHAQAAQYAASKPRGAK